MATFSYQVNVFMEDYGNCSFNFNYNKISNFNDLICSFSTLYPERDICPCSKLYYKSDDNTYKEIYNKTQKFYSLIIRGNQYKISLNKECKCPQVIKDNYKKTKYELLLYFLEKYKNKIESEIKIEKSHNLIVEERDSLFIPRVEKESFEIENIDILAIESREPYIEIEYNDEIYIPGVEKEPLSIENVDFLSIEVNQVLRSRIKSKNYIIEYTNLIELLSLDKPNNKIDYCDTFEIIKEEDTLNKTNNTNSDIDLKKIDPSFGLDNNQNKFMNLVGHFKKNPLLKNNLPRANEKNDSETKKNYYSLGNNINK